uniref:Uncharacterized protein n=1 Tax=Zea mays TaxID=4577 RepID=C4IYI6_MAIZE|nr:unknown [Zea mays]ACR36403.1 unknown [Zea mays]
MATVMASETVTSTALPMPVAMSAVRLILLNPPLLEETPTLASGDSAAVALVLELPDDRPRASYAWTHCGRGGPQRARLSPKAELGNLDRSPEISPASLFPDTLKLLSIGTRSASRPPRKPLCSALRVRRAASEMLRLPLSLLWETSRCLSHGLAVELSSGGRVPDRELFLTASTLIRPSPSSGATVPASEALSRKTPATLPL